MDRVIKFRAWTGKKMMYQEKQYLASFIRRAVTAIMIDHDIEDYRDHESYLPNGGVIDEYLMQFTGIEDNHNAPIYEGDIVRFKNEREYVVGVVQFGKHNGAFCFYVPQDNLRIPMLNFMSTLSLAATYDFEIIGNIHENAELLTK